MIAVFNDVFLRCCAIKNIRSVTYKIRFFNYVFEMINIFHSIMGHEVAFFGRLVDVEHIAAGSQ